MEKEYSLSSLNNQELYVLPIYIKAPKSLSDKAISLNKQLSEELIKIDKPKRSMKLGRALSKILNDYPKDIVVKDFDVLFNPAYKVDVLTLLLTEYRNKPFSIIWPGTYSDGKLIYSEPCYQDYHVYSISNYDVACIV